MVSWALFCRLMVLTRSNRQIGQKVTCWQLRLHTDTKSLLFPQWGYTAMHWQVKVDPPSWKAIKERHSRSGSSTSYSWTSNWHRPPNKILWPPNKMLILVAKYGMVQKLTKNKKPATVVTVRHEWQVNGSMAARCLLPETLMRWFWNLQGRFFEAHHKGEDKERSPHVLLPRLRCAGASCCKNLLKNICINGKFLLRNRQFICHDWINGFPETFWFNHLNHDPM